MYEQAFYIEDEVGNNAFSYEERKNKQLYVPSLKSINSFDEIRLGKEVVFEDFDFSGELQSCKGLENFYEIECPHPNPLPYVVEGITAPIYLFDNHNHAYYFWYKARKEGLIKDGATLYHVDEHSDMRDPGVVQSSEEVGDLEKVFQFTNFGKVNVGNYIIPAQRQGLIGETIQIRNQQNLLDYLSREKGEEKNIILNLDLDFFQPDLDFIDYELKKKVVLDIAQKADLITVATSPFFIDQQLALKVFKDIFGK